MERGRYTTYSTARLPHRKRTIRLRGSFEDNGKYIRCWNCGFIVNTDRDLGDPENSGNYTTEVVVPAQSLAMGGSVSVAEELDTIGTIIKDGLTDCYAPQMPEVSRGCPLCGTNNLM